MSDTIFDKIVSGEAPSWKVWEDDTYVAFLTPFTSQPGAVVVTHKINPGDDLFELNDDQYIGLLKAAKKVANQMKAGLNVDRVAMVVEGAEVPHVHIRLYPMGENYQSYDKPQKVADEQLDQLRDTLLQPNCP